VSEIKGTRLNIHAFVYKCIEVVVFCGQTEISATSLQFYLPKVNSYSEMEEGLTMLKCQFYAVAFQVMDTSLSNNKITPCSKVS
jgi:hypothetical protein